MRRTGRKSPLLSRASRLLGVLAVGLCVAAIFGTAATASQARKSQKVPTIVTRSTLPLRTAAIDPYLFASSQQAQAFQMLRAAGATYARLLIRWSDIAPVTLPLGFDASDPTSVGYFWATTDATVEAAEAAGLTPILDVISPPAWAVTTGGIDPQISPLGEFATALATHYDGHYGVPAAHVFQVWNEPNLSLDLDPVDPVLYRSMVNAVAASVHGVNAKNVVVAGDLDPFANTAARFHTMAPLAFMRAMLCVSKGAKPHSTCNDPAHFDVWSHHPYTDNGPFGHAKGVDDVSLGDLPKMNAVLQAAVKLGNVVSSHPVQFWATEVSWDTNPPRKAAVPLQLEARWTAEALYQMWSSGVSLATWFMLQDQPAPSPWESGLFFASPTLATAKKKPMWTSFRFPFVAYLNKSTVSVWGRDATSTAKLVTIQQRNGKKGKWKTVARIKANRYGIYEAKLKLVATKKDWLRATAPGSGDSLAFSLTRPSSKLRFNPFGKN